MKKYPLTMPEVWGFISHCFFDLRSSLKSVNCNFVSVERISSQQIDDGNPILKLQEITDIFCRCQKLRIYAWGNWFPNSCYVFTVLPSVEGLQYILLLSYQREGTRNSNRRKSMGCACLIFDLVSGKEWPSKRVLEQKVVFH